MNYKISFLALISTLILLFTSCSTHQKINKFNTASTYVDEFLGSFMQQQIFHQNDSISEMAIRIDASKIPGLKSNQVDVYSLMSFKYEVYTSLNKKDIVQSDSYKLAELIPYDKLKSGAVEIKIALKLKQNHHYIILLSVQDQVNKKNYFKMLRIEKNMTSPENYRVITENGDLLWYSWINKKQKIKIQYRQTSQKQIFLTYFEPKFSPAPTPYSQVETSSLEYNNVKPFETYKLRLNNGFSELIQLPKDGAYIIHKDKGLVEGKLLCLFFNSYPLINNDAQKVFALRYLNSRKEFSQMLQDDPSHTVQEFWFFEGRSTERSQQMMTTYYSRVQRANELFTSYKEGWKTDRGMIFMIYGPPDHVYNETDREVWEYGAEASYNDLQFDFLITKTPLNQLEYVLLHQKEYKDSWYAVVQNWRDK